MVMVGTVITIDRYEWYFQAAIKDSRFWGDFRGNCRTVFLFFYEEVTGSYSVQHRD